MMEKLTQHNQFYAREERILETADQLLLEYTEQYFTLDLLIHEANIAKGSLYKHFQSKDELFISLLIRYEKKLLNIKQLKHPLAFQDYIAYLVRYYLNQPKQLILFHMLEERLAENSKGLQSKFAELYQLRRKRLRLFIEKVMQYFENTHSLMNPRDYLSMVWAIVYGGALLLNSSFYQRYIGSRETLKQAYIQQILNLPLNATKKKP